MWFQYWFGVKDSKGRPGLSVGILLFCLLLYVVIHHFHGISRTVTFMVADKVSLVDAEEAPALSRIVEDFTIDQASLYSGVLQLKMTHKKSGKAVQYEENLYGLTHNTAIVCPDFTNLSLSDITSLTVEVVNAPVSAFTRGCQRQLGIAFHVLSRFDRILLATGK